MKRIEIGKVLPRAYSSMKKLDLEVNNAVLEAGISEGFMHLLKLRISQINGCAFCIDLHAKDAIGVGESFERINLLSAWGETDHYTVQEKSALALIEAITNIQMPMVDDICQNAMNVWSENAIAAIEWLAVTMNAWNRIGIASGYFVKDQTKML